MDVKVAAQRAPGKEFGRSDEKAQPCQTVRGLRGEQVDGVFATNRVRALDVQSPAAVCRQFLLDHVGILAA